MEMVKLQSLSMKCVWVKLQARKLTINFLCFSVPTVQTWLSLIPSGRVILYLAEAILKWYNFFYFVALFVAQTALEGLSFSSNPRQKVLQWHKFGGLSYA